MKKTLLLTAFFLSSFLNVNAQVVIYNTTHASLNGTEITPTANGPACSYGDAIQLAGTERVISSIVVDLFTLTDVTPFTVTMSLYTNCPTSGTTGACGSGIGTLIPGSSVTVPVTPPATAGTLFLVTFPYNLNISSEADNTITVMINASRNNVFWTINETPVVGSLPTGDTALSTLTRCGSTAGNNGCNRTFAAPNNNNMSLRIMANALSVNEFLSSKFSVYPNPANNEITISNAENILLDNASITDINGRIVKKFKLTGISEEKINISELNNGIYFLKVETSEGSLTKKIIKD